MAHDCAASPALKMTALFESYPNKVCPHRPRSEVTTNRRIGNEFIAEGPVTPGGSDRDAGLLGKEKRLAYRASRFLTGLLGEASVELDEQVALHPALRANRMMSGEVIPLAELVRSGLPGAVVCRSPFRLSPRSQ